MLGPPSMRTRRPFFHTSPTWHAVQLNPTMTRLVRRERATVIPTGRPTGFWLLAASGMKP